MSRFATIEEAIEDIRAGRMVVVCDDEDRENEGDLTMAAQFATPEAINFMATHGRGLICLCLTPERCEELGLRPATSRSTYFARTSTSRFTSAPGRSAASVVAASVCGTSAISTPSPESAAIVSETPWTASEPFSTQ